MWRVASRQQVREGVGHTHVDLQRAVQCLASGRQADCVWFTARKQAAWGGAYLWRS